MKQDALTITNGLIITREGEPVAGGIRCDGDHIVAIGADVVPGKATGSRMRAAS
jgi:dihydroorotase